MGISFSSSRRNQNQRYQQQQQQHQRPSSYYHNPPLPPPLYFYPSSDPSSVSQPPSPTNNYVYVSAASYPTTAQYNYQYPPSIQSNYHYPGWQNGFNYANPLMGRAHYSHFYGNQGNGWPQMRPPLTIPPPYVEHQSAKVVKNDVNVHKDTIRLETDDNHRDHHLVSFVFDAHFDGSITVYYFAKEEEERCKFTTVYPDTPRPVKIPFKNGVGKIFRQPSGTGVDLGFYELEDLGKPSTDNVYPLVIFAEVHSSQAEDDASSSSLEASPRVQVTQAVIEKKNDDSFEVKVIKQILWIDGVRYEVRELYGIGNSSEQGFNDDEPGKACVICMTEPKDTAVMPCRHLCMCSDCAKELRFQSDKCPICRQPITELIEIKINSSG